MAIIRLKIAVAYADTLYWLSLHYIFSTTFYNASLYEFACVILGMKRFYHYDILSFSELGPISNLPDSLFRLSILGLLCDFRNENVLL